MLCNDWKAIANTATQLMAKLPQSQQLMVTDDDLRVVFFGLLAGQSYALDIAFALQLRAWMTYSVSDCSCSTKHSVMCLKDMLSCDFVVVSGEPKLCLSGSNPAKQAALNQTPFLHLLST